VNIDQTKSTKLAEALGWLEQARKHYSWLQHAIGDDCLKKARAAINDPIFDRQPIPGFARNQQPETLWVRNPVANGKMLINGSDFDPSVHELYVEEATSPAPSKRGKSS